jgi:hypothetical protein
MLTGIPRNHAKCAAEAAMNVAAGTTTVAEAKIVTKGMNAEAMNQAEKTTVEVEAATVVATVVATVAATVVTAEVAEAGMVENVTAAGDSAKRVLQNHLTKNMKHAYASRLLMHLKK